MRVRPYICVAFSMANNLRWDPRPKEVPNTFFSVEKSTSLLSARVPYSNVVGSGSSIASPLDFSGEDPRRQVRDLSTLDVATVHARLHTPYSIPRYLFHKSLLNKGACLQGSSHHWQGSIW